MSGLNQLEEKFYQWLDRNPDARSVPLYIQRYLDQMERHYEGDRLDIVIDENKWDMEVVCFDLDKSLGDYEKRRAAEQELAEYIKTVADSTDSYDVLKLHDVADKLMNCRTSGTVGLKPDGGHVVAWDSKCSMVRLCPDESREETQRLAERYVPAIREWLEGGKRRRAYYLVFTDHNYRVGTLAKSKKYMQGRVRDFIKDKKNKNIKGAFTCQEDPLSASGDWNVHVNVILLVEGSFDYADAREQWGANLHIQQIDPDNLVKSVLELVKYSAQIVPTKSEGKRHKTDAPAMTEWPHDLWVEWWTAQKRFRRVRSYGCLYRIPKPEPELKSLEDVIWVGSVKMDDSGSFKVDLIQGYNFSEKRVITRDSASNYHDSGPQPPPRMQ